MNTLHSAWQRFLHMLVVGVLFGIVATTIFSPHAVVSQVTQTPLTGWLWTDTTGWISLNCADVGSCATSNYKVNQDSNGNLSGYGWSDNVGWVTFNAAQLTGCPQTQTGNTACAPTITSNTLKGWIRVCAGMDDVSLNQTAPNNTCGNGAGTRTDGWDGWVSLYGSGPIAYGATIGTGGSLTGFAWGSDVQGWTQVIATSAAACAPQPTYCDGSGRSCAFNTTSCAFGCTPCQYGCSAVDGQCNAPPTPDGAISARPAILPSGAAAQVNWWAHNIQVNTCAVTQGNTATGWSTTYDSVNASTTGSHVSAAIVGQTVFTLTCTGLDSLSHSWSTAPVNTSPNFEEQ